MDKTKWCYPHSFTERWCWLLVSTATGCIKSPKGQVSRHQVDLSDCGADTEGIFTPQNRLVGCCRLQQRRTQQRPRLAMHVGSIWYQTCADLHLIGWVKDICVFFTSLTGSTVDGTQVLETWYLTMLLCGLCWCGFIHCIQTSYRTLLGV